MMLMENSNKLHRKDRKYLGHDFWFGLRIVTALLIKMNIPYYSCVHIQITATCTDGFHSFSLLLLQTCNHTAAIMRPHSSQLFSNLCTTMSFKTLFLLQPSMRGELPVGVHVCMYTRGCAAGSLKSGENGEKTFECHAGFSKKRKNCVWWWREARVHLNFPKTRLLWASATWLNQKMLI